MYIKTMVVPDDVRTVKAQQSPYRRRLPPHALIVQGDEGAVANREVPLFVLRRVLFF